MLVCNVTHEEQEQRNELNRQLLAGSEELYIRKSFGKAMTTLEAESWITIAQERGMLQLALELQNDLMCELQTSLVG